MDFLDFFLVPICSHKVPKEFLKFPMCFISCSQYHHTLISYSLPPTFHIIYRWARGEALRLPIETSILGSLQSFRVFFFPSSSDGLDKMAHCKKKNNWSWEEERPNCMQSWKICLHIPLEVLEGTLQWPQWISTHQCTIHWMPLTTHLWMNFNRVNIWFHLGNQYCKKWLSYIGK
jgi:hypothetical protein